jgi:hypothetical protein
MLTVTVSGAGGRGTNKYAYGGARVGGCADGLAWWAQQGVMRGGERFVANCDHNRHAAKTDIS